MAQELGRAINRPLGELDAINRRQIEDSAPVVGGFADIGQRVFQVGRDTTAANFGSEEQDRLTTIYQQQFGELAAIRNQQRESLVTQDISPEQAAFLAAQDAATQLGKAFSDLKEHVSNTDFGTVINSARDFAGDFLDRIGVDDILDTIAGRQEAIDKAGVITDAAVLESFGTFNASNLNVLHARGGERLDEEQLEVQRGILRESEDTNANFRTFFKKFGGE